MSVKKALIHEYHTRNSKIEVFEKSDNKSRQRFLEFGDGVIQSAIDINYPCHLPLALNQAMLSVLMFVDTPKQVLLLGTGGGAIARYFSHKNIGGEAVEIFEDITETAQTWFDFPKQQKGWKLVVNDAKEYVNNTDKTFDLIFIDIANASIENNSIHYLTPDWVFETNLLEQYRGLLTPNGALIINVLTRDAETFRNIAQKTRQVFNRQVLFFNLPGQENIIMLAFQQPLSGAEKIKSDKHLGKLEDLWHIEFAKYRDMILKDNPVGSGVL